MAAVELDLGRELALERLRRVVANARSCEKRTEEIATGNVPEHHDGACPGVMSDSQESRVVLISR